MFDHYVYYLSLYSQYLTAEQGIVGSHYNVTPVCTYPLGCPYGVVRAIVLNKHSDCHNSIRLDPLLSAENSLNEST